jgi:hypothetical protein
MTKNRRVKVGVGVIGSQFAADLHAAVFQRSAGETAVVAVASPIRGHAETPISNEGSAPGRSEPPSPLQSETTRDLFFPPPSSSSKIPLLVLSARLRATPPVNTSLPPYRTNFDTSVSKVFKLTEKLQMQFRAEGFNIFNHTQWNG